jgi:hypothetical protein
MTFVSTGLKPEVDAAGFGAGFSLGFGAAPPDSLARIDSTTVVSQFDFFV